MLRFSTFVESIIFRFRPFSMTMIKKYTNDKNICPVTKHSDFFFETLVDKGNITPAVRHLNARCETLI